MCGHVAYSKSLLGKTNVEVTIISRRSNLRAGTRFNVRGLDDDGNCANFVETEQIMLINDMQLSFVITRATVPIFWSQAGKGTQKLLENTHIDRPTKITKGPFTVHFEGMLKDYNEVYIIDLLRDEKEKEAKLWKEYQKLFNESALKEQEKLRFLHFDFKRLCKDNDLQPLKLMINKIMDKMNDYGSFVMYIPNEMVV